MINEANLLKLAAYLEALPPDYDKFDMSIFRSGSGHGGDPLECGAVACGLGHGPLAGIPLETNEPWSRYSARVFGLDIRSPPWRWCFDSGWESTDNTPRGVAARIRWMLAHDGVPKDAKEQQYGDAPLCYSVGAPK